MNPIVPNINGPNPCPVCHCSLPVKLAAGGNFPGQYYIRCHRHNYHYTFMPGVCPDNALAPLFPHSATTALSTKASTECSATTCKKIGNSICSRLMCKKCCVAHSGCGIHMVSLVANKQKGKQPRMRMVGPAGPIIPAPGEDSVAAWKRIDPTVRFMDTVDASMREAELARAQELADEAQEEAEYQAALSASLGYSPPHTFTNPSSSHSTSSSHGASSSRIASSPMASFPLVRLSPSPPASPPRTSSKAPKRTSHLRPEWMRGYEDKTMQPVTKRGRAQGDAALLHKFFIMFWRQDGVPPEVLSVQVSQGWPKWTLAGCPNTQEKLGTTTVDVYNIPNRHWIQVDASWPHAVSTDMYLLFRRCNVKCLDFDKELATITKKTTHLRTNMPGDRHSVRVSRKRKAVLTPSPQSSPPSDVQVAEVLDLTITPKAPAQKRRAPSLAPLTIPVVVIPDSPSTLSTPPPSLCSSSLSSGPSSSSIPSSVLVSPSVSPSILSAPPSPSSKCSPSTTSCLNLSTKWPADCYVVDMRDGFDKIDSRMMRKRYGTVEERLEHVFGQRIKLATYYNARSRWKAASENHCEEAAAAGRTPAGRWSVFARQYPLKNT